MRGVGIASAALLVAALLAGCSDAPSAPAQVLIESVPPEEVRSGDTVPAVAEPKAKTRGHLAGVVVDEAIRPIVNATVRLPGLDLERPTERDGSFGFVDLYPGPYFITVEAPGFYPAEAMLEVREDEFTRARVMLSPVPPPEPYKVTQSFEGYTELTGDPVLGLNFLCQKCAFEFYVDRAGLHTVVVEAVSQGMTAEGDGFYHSLVVGNTYLSSGMEDDPMRVELRSEDLGTDDQFELTVEPATLVPATARRFQVFVTAFYNEGPPTGWSFVNGDP